MRHKKKLGGNNIIKETILNINDSDIVKSVKETIKDPEIKQAISELTETSAQIYKEAQPEIDKMLDQSEHMAKDVGKRMIVIGQELLGEVPIIGPLLELPIIISNVVKLGEKIIGPMSETIGTGIDMWKNKISNKKQQIYNKASLIASKFRNTLKNFRRQNKEIQARTEKSYGQFVGGKTKKIRIIQ